MKLQNLSNFERGDFYSVSNKLVLWQMIDEKDLSEFSFQNVKFFNCNFRNVAFTASEAYSLIFCNCRFNQVSFSKTNLIDISFRNCKLIDCSFGSSDSYCVRYLNCLLNRVYFNAADLMDFEFEKSQLLDVSFVGSDVLDLRIKDSILKDIGFHYMTVSKTFSENGTLIIKDISIQDYTSFLKEFVSCNNFTYQELISRSLKVLAVSIGLGITFILFNIT